MIIFAICMPLVVIALLGIIFGSRPAYPGAGYTFLEQSFGAVSAIAVCAGGVMGLPLVISEYRQKKILKRYQVTPASPALLLAVQTAVYTVYPWHPWFWSMLRRSCFSGRVFPGSAAAYLAVFLFVMLAIFSIGMMIEALPRMSGQPGCGPAYCIFPCWFFRAPPFRMRPCTPVCRGLRSDAPDPGNQPSGGFLGLPAEGIWKSCLYMAVCFLVCGGIALRYFKWSKKAPFRKGPSFSGHQIELDL